MADGMRLALFGLDRGSADPATVRHDLSVQEGPSAKRSVKVGDVRVTYLHVDPASGYSLLEWETPAGVSSPPVHIHHRTDEGFYVLAGRFGFLLDDTSVEVQANAHVLVGKGHRHTFWNAGSEIARCLIILTPPGFEAYFAELSEGLAKTGSEEAAVQVRRELSASFDIEVVGPPITPVAQPAP